jgi:hypothetical protein
VTYYGNRIVTGVGEMPDHNDNPKRADQQSIAVLGVVIAAVLSIMTGEGYFTPFSFVLGLALLFVLYAFDTPPGERRPEEHLRDIAFSIAVALSVIICAGTVFNLCYVVPALLIEENLPTGLTRDETSYWTYFFGDILLGISVAVVGVFVYLRRRLRVDPADQSDGHPLRSQARKELRDFFDQMNAYLK